MNVIVNVNSDKDSHDKLGISCMKEYDKQNVNVDESKVLFS